MISVYSKCYSEGEMEIKHAYTQIKADLLIVTIAMNAFQHRVKSLGL